MKKKYCFLLTSMLLCVLLCSCSLSGQEEKEQQPQNSEIRENALEVPQNQKEQQEAVSENQNSNDDAVTEGNAQDKLSLDLSQTTDSEESTFDETANQQGSSQDSEKIEKNPVENIQPEEADTKDVEDTVIELPIIPFQP